MNKAKYPSCDALQNGGGGWSPPGGGFSSGEEQAYIEYSEQHQQGLQFLGRLLKGEVQIY